MQLANKHRFVSQLRLPPALQLDAVERRRRVFVPDHRAAAISAAIAEPMPDHLFARNLVSPHRKRDILDIALAEAIGLIGDGRGIDGDLFRAGSFNTLVGHSEHGIPDDEIGDARSDRAMAGVERSYDFRTSRSLNNTPPFALSVFGDSMI